MTEQEEKNVGIVKRWIDEVFNQRNWKTVDEVKAEESYVSNSPFPGTTPNLSGFKSAFSHVLNAFPDFGFKTEEIIAKDDVVVVRGNWSGTHKGVYMGISASNLAISLNRIDMLRLEGNRIVEHWGYGDDWSKIRTLTAGLSGPEQLQAPKHE